MGTKFDLLDAGDAVSLYLGGWTLEDIGAALGASALTVKHFLHSRDVPLRTRGESQRLSGRRGRIVLAPELVVPAYLDGVSIQRLSQTLGCHERVVQRTLVQAGVSLRGRGAANRKRLEAMTAENLRELTREARLVSLAKGVLWTSEAVAKRKQTRARHIHHNPEGVVGRGEGFMEGLLLARGLVPVPQLPVQGYNIDLALVPVAVEIHVATSNPLTDPRRLQRAIDLLEWGWHVFYVWVTQAHFLGAGAAEKVLAFYQKVQGNHALPCEYRVVRGSGQLVAGGGLHKNTRTLIPSPVDALY